NAIRVLAMDAVEAARSGHPGMPMGMADIAEVLWNDYLRFAPTLPRWHDRDRFVLSNGHGSMLLYAVAYLTGYAIDIEELASFRQLGSRTAGHPERDLDIGIETTTGPLGQGVANAVGMALAEKVLAATFNRPGDEIVDHYTYVVMGDGGMMDGDTRGWFTDDTPKRFEAYGWHVVPDVDGHDPQAIVAAIEKARAETGRPSLICCKTVIGWGAPNAQGTAATHGAALGPKEAAAVRKNLGWKEPPFVVPAAIKDAWDARERGKKLEAEWQARFTRYREKYPELAAEFLRRMRGELPPDWAESARKAIADIAA